MVAVVETRPLNICKGEGSRFWGVVGEDGRQEAEQSTARASQEH